MKHRIIALLLALSLGLPTLAGAQEATPPALAGGPTEVTGTVVSKNFATAIIYPNPTIGLIDASLQIPQVTGAFTPRPNQILGQATSPLFTAEPGTYRVSLPVVPTGAPFDIDGDGTGEDGLMAFAIIVGSNLVSDSYLEQFEQGGMTSYSSDGQSGQFVEGTLLVYAADDRQVFPKGAGADSRWFTADDERQPLDAGYTKVTLPETGTATFDRSSTVTIDTMEAASEASPDYSGQTWVEALNSLLDRLQERYAYTELRHIDWDTMRATYVPMMQQAQDARDAEAYFGVLNQMASSFLDAHVTAYPATTEGMEIVQAFSLEAAKPYEGTIGAQGEAMSANPDDPAAGLGDNLTIVTVGASGPAHDAGWVPGTQVVSINGKTVKEHRETIPTWLIGSGISTQEKVQYLQTAASLLFPVGAKVTIDYIQPGETAVKTVEMVAGHYETGVPQPVVVPGGDPKPLETSTYTELDGYTVIKWADFEEDIPERIAVLEAALNYAKSQPDSKGIVIDMRGNTGGWEALYMTMESYFFSADHPMNGHVFDDWEWDGTPGGFARVFAPDMTAVSPKPDLAYMGPLAILVDQDCGSSCEFFTQSFQKQGRAIVVGQYATAGAGGNIDQVKMPMGITFQYTVGQSTWAGTDVFNIEAKGVIPDVRVPVTVEGEVARLNGTDIVLDTAIAVLEKANGGASATPAASPEASPGASPAS